MKHWKHKHVPFFFAHLVLTKDRRPWNGETFFMGTCSLKGSIIFQDWSQCTQYTYWKMKLCRSGMLIIDLGLLKRDYQNRTLPWDNVLPLLDECLSIPWALIGNKHWGEAGTFIFKVRVIYPSRTLYFRDFVSIITNSWWWKMLSFDGCWYCRMTGDLHVTFMQNTRIGG